MPRYMIEREFGQAVEEDMQRIGASMKHVARLDFPNVMCRHHALMTIPWETVIAKRAGVARGADARVHRPDPNA
jgi:hypothetical protein